MPGDLGVWIWRFGHPKKETNEKNSEQKQKNRTKRKSTLPAKPSPSQFFWAYGPRGNSRNFFFGVLGSDGKSMEIQKKEKVHCLQNQVLHIFFGPMGLGETLANFFLDVLGSAGKYGNPEERKSTLPAKPSPS